MSPSAVQEHVDDVSTSTKFVPQLPSEADFSTFRSLVPLLADKNLTYLNASYQPPSKLIVHSAVAKFTSDALYNPHPKPQWQNAVEETRTLVGRYINADPSSLAFTRDTSEALGCFIRSLKFEPGDNVVVLDTEHPNQVYGWMALRKAGLEIRQVPTIPAAEETGHVTAANAATFAPDVDERTKAIGLSSIMFHSGQWNDVADICATYRPRGVHVLADLTQQVGFAEVDVRALGVSAAAFSLHKGLNCPTGFAVLYVDSEFIADTDPTPPIVGYRAVSNSAEAEDLAAKLVELQGDGATAQNRGTRPGTDIILDAAGAPPVPAQVCKMAKPGATFGVVGVHRKPTELNFAQLISTELTIVFSVGYPNEIFEVTDDIVDNWDKYAEIVSDQIPFDQALEALELAKSGKANKVVVVFD